MENLAHKKIFISTAIPYVNAKPHIGFALELVQADVVARWYREQGAEVFFLTGTDENSLKNVQAAEKEGVTTRELVDRNAAVFKELARKLNISNDEFIRTSAEDRHFEGARKLWAASRPEDIYKKKYSGLYCVGCEAFVTEKELVEGRCPEHPNETPEKVAEDNYFFKLSSYQKYILELIESDKLKIIPESRKNEILSFIKSGLEDFSISRSRERAKEWGVEVPGDTKQIMYVWYDALSNYITALDYAYEGEKFKQFWTEADKIIHCIGKGVNRFHTVYWPAMLKSAGVRVPDEVFVHGYITVGGQKMSKSIGNVVDPIKLADKYGAEAVRYFLLREIPAYGDGDFSEEKFKARYNGDLANGLGNFTARVLKLAEKYEAWGNNIEEGEVNKAKEVVEEYKFNEGLTLIWEELQAGDKHINDTKPWETGSKDDINKAINILKKVSGELKLFLPETAEKIEEAIKAKKIMDKPLFPRWD